jgi:hypothetical protein
VHPIVCRPSLHVGLCGRRLFPLFYMGESLNWGLLRGTNAQMTKLMALEAEHFFL